MDLGVELREALFGLLGLVLGGLALVSLIGRLVAYGAGSRDPTSERRLRAWEQEDRLQALLPGTFALHAVPRVRPASLDPVFAEREFLAFAQRALEPLLLATRLGRSPPLTLSEGAAEELRAGPQMEEPAGIRVGQVRLRATDRSPEWRTVDIGAEALITEGTPPRPWRLELELRLRLRASLPLPSAAELEALAPSEHLWEVLAVLEQRYVREDRSPAPFTAWGPLSAPPEPLPSVARGDLAALPAEDRELEAALGRLVEVALLEPDSELVLAPLRAGLALERARDAVHALRARLQDLVVEERRAVSLARTPDGLTCEGWVAVRGRRWREDAEGLAHDGAREEVVRGAVELRMLHLPERGWCVWDLRPARG